MPRIRTLFPRAVLDRAPCGAWGGRTCLRVTHQVNEHILTVILSPLARQTVAYSPQGMHLTRGTVGVARLFTTGPIFNSGIVSRYRRSPNSAVLNLDPSLFCHVF